MMRGNDEGDEIALGRVGGRVQEPRQRGGEFVTEAATDGVFVATLWWILRLGVERTRVGGLMRSIAQDGLEVSMRFSNIVPLRGDMEGGNESGIKRQSGGDCIEFRTTSAVCSASSCQWRMKLRRSCA